MAKALLAAATLGMLASIATAQVAGRISGYVRDTTDSVLPGATVTALMIEQQIRRTVSADTTGFYDLLSMPPGTYELTFEAAGFEKTVQTGVRLTSGETLRLDATLRIGQVQTEVTVSSTAVMVNTSTATLSGLVDDRRVVDLPLNGRNVMSLARILPGATAVRAPQEVNNTRDGPTMSVNGGRAISNNFTLNGANFTHFAQTTGMNFPPPDAVQEIRIHTHNFTAEYGNNSSSQVSVTSKAGTNQFHGAAWEFLRNEKLNARSFFQPRRPASKQNQAGFAAGGPVIRNKVFAFGSYQRLWNRPEVGSTQALVPVDAERGGDFRGIRTTLRNPVNALTGQPWTDGRGAPCLAGNVISPNCISPAAKTLMERYVPQSPSGVVVNLRPTPRDNYTWLSRVDWMRNARHSLFAHFFRDSYDLAFSPGSFARYADGTRDTNVWNGSLNSTYTFGPTLLNDTVVSFMRTRSFQGTPVRIPPNSVGIDLAEGAFGEGPTINVTGRFSLNFPGPQIQKYDNFHLRNATTKIAGRHTLRAGYEMLYIKFYLGLANDKVFNFTGARTGDPTADFLLGAFDELRNTFGVRDSAPISWRHQFFVQDDFKILSRLTLTYGLRYEPFLPWRQRYGRYLAVSPGTQSRLKPDAPPGILFPGDPGVPETTTNPDLNNFAPRFGFAWDLFGNGRMSLRGGYGMFFDHISANSVHAAEAPWAGTELLNNGLLDRPYSSLLRIPPPTQVPLPGEFGCVKVNQFPGVSCPLFPLPAQVVARERDLRTPYIQSWNVTVQRQLLTTLMAEASYVGKIGTKLEGHRHWNPAVYMNSPVTGRPPSAQNVAERVLFPETRGIISPLSRMLGNDYRSWYHALQFQVDKRLSKGFSILGSYVFSKNLDTVVNPEPGLTPGVPNPFDLRSLRGRGEYDRRHAVALSWLWSPAVRFGNPVLNHLLAGWTISGLHTFQSGPPVNIVMGTDIALDGTGQGSLQQAMLVPGVTYKDVRINHSNRGAMIQRFFNTEAFVPVAQLPRGIYGSAGRNFLSGPADVNSDMAVLKDFLLREKLRMQLRGEFFNALNQVNFNEPENRRSTATFGRILGAGPGRQAQMALKLIW